MAQTNSTTPQLVAWTVTGNDSNKFWTRIGAAWSLKNGGLSVQLNATPLDGRIVLLPPKDRTDEGDAPSGSDDIPH